jgi:hypothetical protein
MRKRVRKKDEGGKQGKGVEREEIDTTSTRYLREGTRNRTWRPPSQRMATRTSTPQKKFHKCDNTSLAV